MFRARPPPCVPPSLRSTAVRRPHRPNGCGPRGSMRNASRDAPSSRSRAAPRSQPARPEAAVLAIATTHSARRPAWLPTPPRRVPRLRLSRCADGRRASCWPRAALPELLLAMPAPGSARRLGGRPLAMEPGRGSLAPVLAPALGLGRAAALDPAVAAVDPVAAAVDPAAAAADPVVAADPVAAADPVVAAAQAAGDRARHI